MPLEVPEDNPQKRLPDSSNLTVDQQLDLDQRVYGVAYYTEDELGNKTRIDPKKLTIIRDGIYTIAM